MKFRKKPIIIDAVQYLGDNIVIGVCNCDAADPAHCHTLEGPLHVSAGDWIITGVKGEKYPCKPDIFEKTYEPASASDGATRVKQLVLDQAQDEGLWAVPFEGQQPIMEAYLQQELRKLHAAVEEWL